MCGALSGRCGHNRSAPRRLCDRAIAADQERLADAGLQASGCDGQERLSAYLSDERRAVVLSGWEA
jgi:hypothetical protein